ncbi:MAG: Maf family protein [Sphaerochaetaceae bacterium]|nr:Maf family protein [Sphaerochaetaceae bacterium]
MNGTKVILASQSSARKALLQQSGFTVIPIPTLTDESHSIKDPSEAAQTLALRKLHVCLSRSGAFTFAVIAADTIVSIDGTQIGKPADRNEAFSQLSLLQGRSHTVISGYAVFLPLSEKRGRIYCGCDEVTVRFFPLDESQIESYLSTDEYIGAAGSYRIQQRGKQLISSISGDFSTVVGLPITKISAILEKPENFLYQEYPPNGEK